MNHGLTIELESDGFILNEILIDPIMFLDNNGALGFTKAWATKEINLLGGNDKDIHDVIRISIFNQNAHMINNWLVIQLKSKVSLLSMLGQVYNIVEKYKENS